MDRHILQNLVLLGLFWVMVGPVMAEERQFRVATFNTSLYRPKAGQLIEELRNGEQPKIQKVAAILQHVRPDVVLLNEFDYDEDGLAATLFQKNYLAVSQAGQEPLQYEYWFSAPVNTGVPSGLDLDLDGKEGRPTDAFGYGTHPGQYGMLVLSKYPIDKDKVRTFQKFLWKDMPKPLLPVDPESHEPFYTKEILKVFRLSSKSHWDVPLKIGEQTVHFLVSHPTPPAFDGPEDRNGRRNHDEIRLWKDYISEQQGNYLYDDQGNHGGLPTGAHFIIAGDLNADPLDGTSTNQAMQQLLKHPLVNTSVTPSSKGGKYYAKQQGGKNRNHRADPQFDTGDFFDQEVGNLRVDYVLPSKTLEIQQAKVFWPLPGAKGSEWIDTSDHRLVWVDLKVK